MPAKNKAIQYEKQIKEAFIECKGRFGRERLSLFLKEKVPNRYKSKDSGQNYE
ncbi:hypothetical protein [Ureaplasma parvum]|uniref:hypothetical protein n=1 Tax=Ureaplasma parvum TaxID=134821 RepID=UPI000169D3F3|nr:hypothetical protein [Ureaplasma parvum]